MSRRSVLTLVFLAVAALSSSVASGQVPTSGLSLNIKDSRKVDGGSNPVYIKASECGDSPKVFEFDYTPLASSGSTTSTIPFVEVWVAQGTSTDCSTPAARKSTTSGSAGTQSQCWKAWSSASAASGTNIMVNTKLDVDINAGAIFNGTKRDGTTCDSARGSQYRVYFVPLPSETVAGTEPASPVSGVQSIYATFTLYSQLPAAPSGVKAKSGESAIGASWDGVTAGTNTRYKLYFDAGNGDGEDCGSGVLVAGKAPPSDGVYTASSDSTSGTLGGLDAKGIAVGDSVAVAVTTLDIAENESLLSDVICVDRVATTGFWDACKADANCKDDFEKCSAAPWRTAHGVGSALALLACGVMLVRRRRRNV